MIITRLPSDIQIVSYSKTVYYGEDMMKQLEEKGIDSLVSGTVLVARFGKLFLMFEINAKINFDNARGANMVYVIPGSRIPLNDMGEVVKISPEIQRTAEQKVILLRDCRLPFISEYEVYQKYATI